jgi:hypothetical protein
MLQAKVLHMQCVVTGKNRADSPEEQVRQAVAKELMDRYGYRREDLHLELPLQLGSKGARAGMKVDIAIFHDGAAHTQENAYILVECKRRGISKSGFDDAVAQLKSYLSVCNNSHFGMVTDGTRRVFLEEIKEKDGQYRFREIPDIPRAGGPRARFTYVDGEALSRPSLVTSTKPALSPAPQVSTVAPRLSPPATPPLLPAPSSPATPPALQATWPQSPPPRQATPSAPPDPVRLGSSPRWSAPLAPAPAGPAVRVGAPQRRFPVLALVIALTLVAATAAAVALVRRPGLAQEDVGFIDTRKGGGWGDRCFLHLQAGRLDAAKAACDRGLAMAEPRGWTRGSLLYNLGMIAEKEEDLATARQRYRESLSVRPTGSSADVVRRALAAIDGK